MFSRILVPLILAFALIACSREGERDVEPIVVDKAGTDCLSSFSTHLSNYLDGQMNNTEVGEFWDCTAHAINEYRRLTAGEETSDRYKPENIVRFLQKHFIKGTEISPGLLKSIMDLKRVVIGGGEDVVTRQELVRLNELLMLLKELSRELNPHVRVVFLRNEKASDQEILAASEASRRVLTRLGVWLTERHEELTFAELRALIAELDEWFQEDKGLISSIGENFEVVPAFKKILLSGSERGFTGDEWAPLMKDAGDAFFAFLTVNYAFKADLNSILIRPLLPRAILVVGEVLKRSASRHAGSAIDFNEFAELFRAVEKAEWLPKEFSSAALGGVVKFLGTRLLGGTQDLSVESIGVLTAQMENWMALHEQAVTGRASASRLNEKYEAILAASAPLEWDGEGRMAFLDQPSTRWSAASRIRMVWPFVILNWIKESYVGVDVDELNGDQMLEVAGEILPVLHGFGWMLSTEAKIGTKLMREADLFTLSSQGDGAIQLHEATRYLAFVASGFRGAQLWLEGAEKICPSLDAVCVRNYGAILSNGVLKPFPRLVRTLQGKPVSEFIRYTEMAEQTVLEETVVGRYGVGDLLQTWIIFQYVETFERRFDADKSETISFPESTPAYQLFGPTLEILTAQLGLEDSDLHAFFTFLLANGETPFTMFGGGVLWLNWKWHQNDWVFESDRTKLLGILFQLSKL